MKNLSELSKNSEFTILLGNSDSYRRVGKPLRYSETNRPWNSVQITHKSTGRTYRENEREKLSKSSAPISVVVIKESEVKEKEHCGLGLSQTLAVDDYLVIKPSESIDSLVYVQDSFILEKISIICCWPIRQ